MWSSFFTALTLGQKCSRALPGSASLSSASTRSRRLGCLPSFTVAGYSLYGNYSERLETVATPPVPHPGVSARMDYLSSEIHFAKQIFTTPHQTESK